MHAHSFVIFSLRDALHITHDWDVSSLQNKHNRVGYILILLHLISVVYFVLFPMSTFTMWHDTQFPKYSCMHKSHESVE